jgi:hypothetical protein
MTGLATLLRLDSDRKHAFRIRGIDRQLAPGAYEVITDEEMIEGLSLPSFRELTAFCKVQGLVSVHGDLQGLIRLIGEDERF